MTFVDDLGAGARRSWPALALIGYLAYFDFRLKGNALFSLLLAAAAAAPLLLRATLGSRVRNSIGAMSRAVPPRYRGLVVAGLPVTLLYLTRWKGTQSSGAALLSVAIPLGAGAFVAANRERLDVTLAPFYRRRNAVLPKAARVPLAIALPIVLSFAVAHGSLADLPAFFGGTTNTFAMPGNRTLALLATVALSAACAFLLLNDPPSPRDPT